MLADSSESVAYYLFFHREIIILALKGAYEKSVTVTATAVIQLLSPVFSFVLQLFLFPDIVWWRSGLGIFFIILAVGTQLIVLKQRETEIRKELQAHIQNDGFELKEA